MAHLTAPPGATSPYRDALPLGPPGPSCHATRWRLLDSSLPAWHPACPGAASRSPPPRCFADSPAPSAAAGKPAPPERDMACTARSATAAEPKAVGRPHSARAMQQRTGGEKATGPQAGGPTDSCGWAPSLVLAGPGGPARGAVSVPWGAPCASPASATPTPALLHAAPSAVRPPPSAPPSSAPLHCPGPWSAPGLTSGGRPPL